MPLLLAWLAGAADFAAEMLVLRSGRFGLGASAQSTTLLIALVLCGFGVGASLARYFTSPRGFALARGLAGFLAAIAIAGPLYLCSSGGVMSSVAAPTLAMAGAFLFALPAGASLPFLYEWTGGNATRAGLLIAMNAFGSVVGAWLGGLVGPTQLGSYACALLILAADLLLAASALVLGKSFVRKGELPFEPVHAQAEARALPGGHIHLRVLRSGWLAFSAGALTLALEALLQRLIPFFLGDCSDGTAWLL